MTKPLKFHETLNLAPRSAKHGPHRRANPPSHRRSANRADHGTGGTVPLAVSWSTTGSTFTWFADPFSIPEPPEPPTIPYAGIRTGELIGHRLWWVIEEAGEQWLCSLAHRRLWQPGETVSGKIDELVVNAPLFPIWGGTYSFFERSLCDEEIKAHSANIAIRLNGFVPLLIPWSGCIEASAIAVGTIKMWGDVVEHETGYRAEFAKLNSIDEMIGPGDIDLLRARYGVCALSSTQRETSQ